MEVAAEGMVEFYSATRLRWSDRQEFIVRRQRRGDFYREVAMSCYVRL